MNMSELPEAKRQKLIDEFVSFTNTSKTQAQNYLEKGGWNLESCVNTFFDTGMSSSDGLVRNTSEVRLSDDDDDTTIPDVETCQKLVEEFAGLTNTDEACAQFYLQDRDWNLQRSLDAFFEEKVSASNTKEESSVEPKVAIEAQLVDVTDMASSEIETPKQFKLLTWNVDGLDARNLNVRTKAVCKIIKMEDADIVFLQELIPATFSYLESNLLHYMSIAGNTQEYFTAMFLKRSTVFYDQHNIKDFPNSTMGRNLITAEVCLGKVPLTLMTSHLESTKDHASERKSQLKTAFQAATNADSKHTVLFAGDLNLRDKELMEIGGLPNGLEDMWIACGKRSECEYTWDARRNVNIQIPGTFRPKSRFDRVYTRHSSPPSIVPKHFGLVGIQKIRGMQCFPSDHWGITVTYDTGAG